MKRTYSTFQILITCFECIPLDRRTLRDAIRRGDDALALWARLHIQQWRGMRAQTLRRLV
jgi:hypothetical protein